MRTWIPWACATIVIAIAAAVIWWPRPNARTAVNDLASVLFEHASLGTATVYSGLEPIPPDQAQSLLWELGERHFHGFSVVARDRRGFGGAQAAILVTARDSKGRIRRVALNCLDNDHGGGIDLRRLLECIWDSDAVAELGQYPADPSVRYSYYARGLEADRTILEAHGVTRLVGKNSGWTTLDEVLRSYQESVTAHRN